MSKLENCARCSRRWGVEFPGCVIHYRRRSRGFGVAKEPPPRLPQGPASPAFDTYFSFSFTGDAILVGCPWRVLRRRGPDMLKIFDSLINLPQVLPVEIQSLSMLPFHTGTTLLISIPRFRTRNPSRRSDRYSFILRVQFPEITFILVLPHSLP